MTELHCWLKSIKSWYQPNHSHDFSDLVSVIQQTPQSMMDELDTETGSEALAYWLDACFRLTKYYQHQGYNEQAFGYIQLSYAKLQAIVCEQSYSAELKRWSLKKLHRIIVAMVEFCQHQSDPQWQQESIQLINLHVAFMESQQHLNLSYAASN
ncbi:hypothetical protein ACOX9X_21060 [Photobacterium leiognathi subsp. mandapamensis]|uniref:hypothetical protein n=1 Tax=Photobacterium leiognathi TaxID=553611 RepID=UPI003BF54672